MMLSRLRGGRKYVFAAWNPADKGGAAITLSNGDLTAAGTSGPSMMRATIGKSTGKWYWEDKFQGGSGVAVCNSVVFMGGYAGQTGDSAAYGASGQIVSAGSVVTTVSPLVVNDVVGFALDASAKTIKIYKNNVFQYTASVPAWASIFPLTGAYSSSWQTTSNFGASPFVYAPPAGYNAGLYLD